MPNLFESSPCKLLIVSPVVFASSTVRSRKKPVLIGSNAHVFASIESLVKWSFLSNFFSARSSMIRSVLSNCSIILSLPSYSYASNALPSLDVIFSLASQSIGHLIASRAPGLSAVCGARKYSRDLSSFIFGSTARSGTFRKLVVIAAKTKEALHCSRLSIYIFNRFKRVF